MFLALRVNHILHASGIFTWQGIYYDYIIRDEPSLQKIRQYSNSHYKNRFFESPPKAGFQKTDFGVPIAVGAGNTKIGFIMRIAATSQ